MADQSGAHPERNIPLVEYRNRLRELFGPGGYRISKTGTIFVVCGGFIRWGRVGSPATVNLLFPEGGMPASPWTAAVEALERRRGQS